MSKLWERNKHATKNRIWNHSCGPGKVTYQPVATNKGRMDWWKALLMGEGKVKIQVSVKLRKKKVKGNTQRGKMSV
jgi:hypothetical protein